MFAVRIKHRVIDGIETRLCPNCKRWLALKLFSKNRCMWDGLQRWCKECIKKYNTANMKKIVIKGREWRLSNPEQCKKTRADYYQAHKQESYEYCKARRLSNPERQKAYEEKFHAAHPERGKEYRQRSKEKNPEAYQRWYNRGNKKRRATLKGKLCDNVASNLYQSLKGDKEGKRTFEILGYTYKQLKQRLTRTMPDGFSWQDYMAGKLHLDHKVPISVFNFKKTTDIDFRRCWALKNLQLLPAIDNIKKGAKLDKHFQPSLIFQERGSTI